MTRSSWIGKAALIAAMVIILACGSFGMAYMGMGMGNDMTPCPFSTGTSVCTMSPLEHLSASHSMFTMVAPVLSMILFLLTITSLAATFILFTRAFAPPRFALSLHALRRRKYIPYRVALQEAFSNGILNPKAF